MKILVVEDQVKIATSLKKGLENEGYSVDLAADGLSGFECGLRSDSLYDAVILDVMLPGLDGFEVCRRWRRKGKAFPILMLTAKGDVVDRITGLDTGADDYLLKPFVLDELLARLRALLRRPKVVPVTTYQVRDIVVDAFSHSVTIQGVDPRLTLKEFGLLELFLRQTGRVLTRENILSNLWDFEFDGASNIVDVHVKNLRKKIKAIRAKAGIHDEVIETVRGLGYRFKG